MIDGMVFPDVREAVQSLTEGTTHGKGPLKVYWFLPVDAYSNPSKWPLLHLYSPGGTQGSYDRVDRLVLELFAPGTEAVESLESVVALICGTDIETPAGFLDSIRVERVPRDVPFQSDAVNKAEAELLVTSRPK